MEELDWLRGSRACNDFLTAALQLKSSDFSYWSSFEDASDSTLDFIIDGTQPDALHVLMEDAWSNGDSWGQFVVAAVSAGVCYAGAAFLWRFVAPQKRKM